VASNQREILLSVRRSLRASITSHIAAHGLPQHEADPSQPHVVPLLGSPGRPRPASPTRRSRNSAVAFLRAAYFSVTLPDVTGIEASPAVDPQAASS
jgi:hypothetical protein